MSHLTFLILLNLSLNFRHIIIITEGEVQAESMQVTGENAATITHILFDDKSAIDPSGARSDEHPEEHVESDDPKEHVESGDLDNGNETQIEQISDVQVGVRNMLHVQVELMVVYPISLSLCLFHMEYI